MWFGSYTSKYTKYSSIKTTSFGTGFVCHRVYVYKQKKRKEHMGSIKFLPLYNVYCLFERVSWTYINSKLYTVDEFDQFEEMNEEFRGGQRVGRQAFRPPPGPLRGGA